MTQTRKPTSRPPSVTTGTSAARVFSDHFGWVAGLFLFGLGAKLWLIHHAGSSLPVWDQWNGEGAAAILPWLNHRLSFADLARAHNEHRIFFTRLCNLLLTALNGEWDNQVEIMFNAVVHCAVISGFGWLMAAWMGRKSWFILWPVLAMILFLPSGWDNALGGFQSQFYFLIGASLLTLWLLGLSAPWTLRWWLGAGAGFAALFTMASGLLATAAVAVPVCLGLWKNPAGWRKQWPTLVVCAAISLLGWRLTPDVPQHHELRPDSVYDFVMSFGCSLAWPWFLYPGLALMNLLPLGMLGWSCLRSTRTLSPAERMTLGVALWLVAQCLASAFARGAAASPPAFRYMDLLAFLVVTNGLAIALLFARKTQLAFPKISFAACVIWSVSCVAGLIFVSHICLQVYRLPDWGTSPMGHVGSVQLATTRAFLATDDPAVFRNKPLEQLPFPDIVQLVELLRNPGLRRVLPACVRVGLPVVPRRGDNSAFSMNGLPPQIDKPADGISWGSFSANGLSARGTFESLPIKHTDFTLLEIPVAGDLGKPGLSLELVELQTGKVIPVPAPPMVPEHWSNAHAPSPAGDFKIVARDDSDSGWFAFQEPRELGRLSLWAEEIPAFWPWFLAGGLLLFALESVRALRRPCT